MGTMTDFTVTFMASDDDAIREAIDAFAYQWGDTVKTACIGVCCITGTTDNPGDLSHWLTDRFTPHHLSWCETSEFAAGEVTGTWDAHGNFKRVVEVEPHEIQVPLSEIRTTLTLGVEALNEMLERYERKAFLDVNWGDQALLTLQHRDNKTAA